MRVGGSVVIGILGIENSSDRPVRIDGIRPADAPPAIRAHVRIWIQDRPGIARVSWPIEDASLRRTYFGTSTPAGFVIPARQSAQVLVRVVALTVFGPQRPDDAQLSNTIDRQWPHRCGVALLVLGCLVVSALAPLEVRVIRLGLEPIVGGGSSASGQSVVEEIATGHELCEGGGSRREHLRSVWKGRFSDE